MDVIGDWTGAMWSPRGRTVPLIEVIPGLDRWFGDTDRSAISRLRLPFLTAFDGTFDLEQALLGSGAFAIVIVDGMMLRTFGLAEHCGLQLLGPGDLISRPGEDGSELLTCGGLQARGVVRFAALDDHILALAQRYPRIIESLQACGDRQQQRLLAQLLICQMPRVEDRVLALMWLLAETWARVTSSGTVLPMRLTHDAIGLLVGARRSTITLALGALEERGALVRRSDDWLLLEQPRPSAGTRSMGALPRLVPRGSSSPWAQPAGGTPVETPVDPVARLRVRRAATIEESRARIARARATSRRSQFLTQGAFARRSGGDRFHHEDDPGDLAVALSRPDR